MLSYITDKALFIKGTIKDSNEDFIVEELPLYLPSGEGQHIYLLIRKNDLSTKDLIKKLQKTLSIAETDIGYAGLKDKNAITTQWISLSLGATANIDQIKEKILESIDNIEIIESSKHTNKIKTSHLVGNRFTIRVNNISENALDTAKKIQSLLIESGFPNYYGPQRFGSKGTNHLVGKQILLKEKKEKRHWVRKLMLSAYQSYLFNEWLNLRIQKDLFQTLIEGDLLVSKTGNRPFPYDPNKPHVEEFKSRLISFTGPMFGNKVTVPSKEALELEKEVFSNENLNDELVKTSKLPGARRASHIFLDDLSITQDSPSSLVFSFSLPSGAYATSLLREFLKESI